MKYSVQQILQQLEGLYTKQEISVLTQLIIEEISNAPSRIITKDKNNHLSSLERKKTEDIARRLKRGEPIQYILGKTEFYGMSFLVTPDVLIPRPETEELVEWVLAGGQPPDCSILDIGTGSGCIAVTLAKKILKSNVYAWDISEKALKVASENAILNGVHIEFSVLDIFQPVDSRHLFNIIVSNPPYVMESEKETMESNVLCFEPHEALFVPDDHALVFYERIADIALVLLHNGGELYFEINRDKGEELVNMLQSKGFINIELRKDISRNDRMVKAIKPEYYG